MQNETAIASTKTHSTLLSLQVGDFLYWGGCAVLSALLAVPFARSFEYPTSLVNFFGAALYLLSGAVLAFIYSLRCRRSNWTKIIIGALIMLLSSAVVFSIVRQNTTLVVFMSSFSLPGSIFGGLRRGSKR